MSDRLEPQTEPLRTFVTRTTIAGVCTAKREAERTAMRQAMQAKILPDGTWIYGYEAARARANEVSRARMESKP